MRRREILGALGASPFLWVSSAQAEAATAFDSSVVSNLARARSALPYEAPPVDLPGQLASISYDAYRAIRFRPGSALWANKGLPFSAHMFHRGLFFKDRVDLYDVHDGVAEQVPYDASWFTSDKADLSQLPSDLGYAGFRLHGAINRPDYFDEVAVFLGASYFRSLGRNQAYGLSARGLALNTGGAGGEEFPAFRRFWIERPAVGGQAVFVHALMDSPSTTGAYRFAVRPGDWTTFDVEARLYPRVPLKSVGVAPLTSMFLLGPGSAKRFDDFRPAVYDSDGLQVANGAGERLWRPLVNPNTLQESTFHDHAPRGFGLIQRSTRLADFQDMEARYDRRPSLWVEPQGDWGRGAVHLLEIPSKQETDDNIVAFWRPEQPLQPGVEHLFRYRLSWGPPPVVDTPRVVGTRTGAGFDAPNVRLFTIDYALPPGTDLDGVQPRVSTSAGVLSPPTLTPNPDTGGVRLDVHLTPGSARTAELRADLTRGEKTASEIWMYRWTA